MMLGPALLLSLAVVSAAGGRAYVLDPETPLLDKPTAQGRVVRTLALGTAVKTTGRPQDGFVAVKAPAGRGFVAEPGLGKTRPTLAWAQQGLARVDAAGGGDPERLRWLWRVAVLSPGVVTAWDALVGHPAVAADPLALARAMEGRAHAALQDGSWDHVAAVTAHGHAWWPVACGPGVVVAPQDGGQAPGAPSPAWLLTTEGLVVLPPTAAPGCVVLDGGGASQLGVPVPSDAPGVLLRAGAVTPRVETLDDAQGAPACGGNWTQCAAYATAGGGFMLQLAGRTWDGEDPDNTHAPGLAESAWRASWKTAQGTRWSSWQPFARAPGDSLPTPVAVLEDSPGVRRVAFWLGDGPCCPSQSFAWMERLALAKRTVVVSHGAVVQGGLGANAPR